MTPSISIVYGSSKDGKSSDAIATFPRGYFVGKPQAFDCSSVWGISLLPSQIGQANTLDDVIQIVSAVGRQRVFNAIVVDDLTILIDVTVAAISPSFKNQMRMWGVIKNKMIEVRRIAEECGLYVVFNSHVSPPIYFDEEDNEVSRGNATIGMLKQRGGPAIAGQMREGLPAICNQVLRTEKQRPGSKLLPPGYWPTVLRLVTDEPWITGDRNDTAFDGAPLNLRELLREAARRDALNTGAKSYDYGIKRWPGLEWQEEAVERLAPLIVKHGFGAVDSGKVDWQQLITMAEDDVRSRYRVANERHARWAVRDALAAAQYRHQYTLPLRRYGVKAAGAAGVFG